MALRRTREQHRDGHDDVELVASAVVDVTTPDDLAYFRSVIQHQQRQNRKPWQWYSELGEVHYALSRGARIAGYVRLGAYKLDANGNPGKQITGDTVEARVARRLSSPYGGTRALAERYFTLMKVPAECWLVRLRVDGEIVGYDFVGAEEWDLASVEEAMRSRKLKPDAKVRRITMPAAKGGGGTALSIEIEARDILGRVWRPSARWIDMADSSLLSNETNCDLLSLLTKGLRAKLLNRLIANGVWYVPSELNDIRTAAPTGEGEERQLSSNKVVDKLLKSAIHGITNPGDPTSALPNFVVGPAAHSEAFRHITADLQVYDVEMKLRQELIDRILMGLDVQPQDVKGMGDSNHWSAWAVSDDERRVNVQPEIETMCWALTEMVLRAEMREAGLPAGRISNTIIWYDMTRANVKTNLAEDARQASDRGQISDSGARLLTGIDESLAPSEDERIRWVGRQIRDPYLATFGLKRASEIDWGKVGAGKGNGPQANSPADKPKAGPGNDSGAPGKSESNTPRKLRPA